MLLTDDNLRISMYKLDPHIFAEFCYIVTESAGDQKNLCLNIISIFDAASGMAYYWEEPRSDWVRIPLLATLEELNVRTMVIEY